MSLMATARWAIMATATTMAMGDNDNDDGDGTAGNEVDDHGDGTMSDNDGIQRQQ